MPHSQTRYRNVVILTLRGFEKLEAAISQTDIWSDDTKSCTLEALSQLTGLSTHTLSKVHARKTGVDLRTLVRYFRAFNLTLETSDYLSPIRLAVSPSKGEFHNHTVSWGLAPDVSVFYGRTAELTTLSHWVLEERCRLVTLIGMGGIGKTWLATKLVEQVQHQFQAVIWHSLRTMPDTPACNDLLDDLMRHLAAEWHRLIAYYGGNPLFLEILAVTIKDLFDGSLTAFFSHNTLILDEIRELLDRQFDCLSPLEHKVMKVLAERDISLSFAELRSHISPTISTSVLLAVLKSLKARSLIEKNTPHISLQLLLRDYLRERYQCRVSILVPTPIC